MITIEYQQNSTTSPKPIDISPITTWEEVSGLLQSGKHKRVVAAICTAIIHLDDLLLHTALIRYMLGKYYRYITAEQIVALSDAMDLPTIDTLPPTDIFGILDVSDRFEHESLRLLKDSTNYLRKHTEGKAEALGKLTDLYTLRTGKESKMKPAAAVAYTLGSISYIRKTYAKTLYRPNPNTGEAPPKYNFGWYEIALQVAKGTEFGNVDFVLDYRFHDIAVHLILQQQESDRIAALSSVTTTP